jgi:hypothetical protein
MFAARFSFIDLLAALGVGWALALAVALTKRSDWFGVAMAGVLAVAFVAMLALGWLLRRRARMAAALFDPMRIG